MPPETAVAVREEHPIIAAIDQRMPEIAEILPDGMKPERFRKVVVQAMLRTPALWACTPISIITAITEAAEVGIEPTGVLGKGWLIPYKGEAKFIPGWRGFVDLMWRADKILTTVDLVRVGDEFSYRRGTDKYLHHVPDLSDPEREASDENVTFAYVMVEFPDGRSDFEVMSRAALNKIKAASLAKARDKSNAIWNTNPGEMMKKTPIRRIAKRMPLSPAVQAMLGRDEEIDFETPVERVADERAGATRSRITERTNALRAGQPAPTAGDPWMREIHAIGSKRGIDHDKLHDYAVRRFGVESLKDLTPSQRADMTEAVEKQPVIEPVTEQKGPAADVPPTEGSVAGTPDAEVVSPAASASDLLQATLDATGGSVEPQTPDYVLKARAKAKEAATEKANRAPKTAPDLEPLKAGL